MYKRQKPLQDSIGKTLGIAEKAPPALRPVIESAARESFVSGMHLASVVAAGILLIAALSVLKWLPARAPDDDRSGPTPPTPEDAVPRPGAVQA